MTLILKPTASTSDEPTQIATIALGMQIVGGMGETRARVLALRVQLVITSIGLTHI
jgi:hypothetical protein